MVPLAAGGVGQGIGVDREVGADRDVALTARSVRRVAVEVVAPGDEVVAGIGHRADRRRPRRSTVWARCR